ncbi:hypothetical protein PTKIN_Ptkin11bG0091600 [Pterospermum kingtungense]
MRAIKVAGEYLEANQCLHESPFPQDNVWTAPPFGFYKLNVDGGFDQTTNIAKCGIVIRDCEGQEALLVQYVESDSKQAIFEVYKGGASESK